MLCFFLGGSVTEMNSSEITFESISLVFDENLVLPDQNLLKLPQTQFEKHQKLIVSTQSEFVSSRLWNLPEVFRRELKAIQKTQVNEVFKQNRLADTVRYNFSNGWQISAQDILRHPIHKILPIELLPLPVKNETPVLGWTLVQSTNDQFFGQSLLEVEAIVQALILRAIQNQKKYQYRIYLQHKTLMNQAIEALDFEFDVKQLLYWRVDFDQKSNLELNLKLIAKDRGEFYFFESYAVCPQTGRVIVHSWLKEFYAIQRQLSYYGPEKISVNQDMPTLKLSGQLAVKKMIQFFKGRLIPIEMGNESIVLAENQIKTILHLQEQGLFQVEHVARIQGQVDFSKKNLSTTTVLFLHSLNEGIGYFLNTDVKDLASSNRQKREWDMRLLKHLGVLQYVFFEVLSLKFDDTLSDGRVCLQTELFDLIQENIKMLLLSGTTGQSFVKDMPLDEICSKSTLVVFDQFCKLLWQQIDQDEVTYNLQGEVILQGLNRREFRFIYALMKNMVVQSRGEIFKKTRTGLLSKISNHNENSDPELSQLFFYAQTGDSEQPTSLVSSIDVLQSLQPFGFELYYKNQKLQELSEDEFLVDFTLQTVTGQRNINWFELNPQFFLHGQEVQPENILATAGSGVIIYQDKIYLIPRQQIPSMQKLEKFWEKLQKGKDQKRKSSLQDKFFQLPRHQTLELLALRASGIKIRGDHEWQRLCEFYDRLGSAENNITIPKSVKAELKDYQKKGVQWLNDLYQLRLGALLADDMGLGKTIQTLSFFSMLQEKNDLGQVLIVVPATLIYNWQCEIEKFTSNIQLNVYQRKDAEKIGRSLFLGESMVVITTYGLLLENNDYFSQFDWNIIVFDEAQNLKNLTTKRTNAARALKGKFKICLTGTPLENHYGEFYSLVDLIVPGSLGPIDEFRKQFVHSEIIVKNDIEDLKLKIKPLLLRRTKKEILNQLPEKQETKVLITFEEEQREIYRDVALAYNNSVKDAVSQKGEASVQLQMLTALLRLRQICSDPAALPNTVYNKVPPKIETLLESLQEIIESGESALVFTQFLQTLEHTQKLLIKNKLPVYVLHGGIPTKQRQQILSDFQNANGGAIMLMTLKTGGVGLNLTKASYVFHLEPWWNPAVENQATDRAHRLGQQKAVQVFKYIMHDSLEEKIELLKFKKEKQFNALLAEQKNIQEQELNLELNEDVNDVNSQFAQQSSNMLTKQDFDYLLGIT